MKDFAAIDFETANGYRSSICSVGVVVVRNGTIVNKYYKLVHPIPNYYNAANVRIHHITPDDTECADLFPEVWAEVVQLIEGLPLVAHNSAFDEGCLKAAFARFEMDYPDYEFHCTCRASRRHLKGEIPDNRLPTVAKYCGYNLEDHHHALADAEACAAIALKLL